MKYDDAIDARKITCAGADPGILVRGAWIFFSMAWGLVGALKLPILRDFRSKI